MVRSVMLVVAFVLLHSAAAAQQASSWTPPRPVRLIIPVQPGAASDVIGRLIAQKVSEKLGQSIVIDNRGGGGGNIGLDLVAKANPDGTTLGMSNVATHGINASLYGSKMPFDPVRDFTAITLVADLKNVLVVHPSMPVKSLAELIAYARANPGKLTFASAGVGTAQHLAGEMLKNVAGLDITHVPYPGAARAVPDLLAGRVSMMFLGVPDAAPHIKGGALRGLAISTAARSELLFEIASVAEQGYPDFDIGTWFALHAPANTPPDVVNRYYDLVVDALNQADVKEKFRTWGVDPLTMPPDRFADFVRSEIKKWAAIVAQSGAKLAAP